MSTPNPLEQTKRQFRTTSQAGFTYAYDIVEANKVVKLLQQEIRYLKKQLMLVTPNHF